jgi:hypothetical protein
MSAQAFTVSKVTATVKPTEDSHCPPGVFYFDASIEIDLGGTLSYRWEFSDGSWQPTVTETAPIGGSWKAEGTAFQTGSPGTNWGRLHVLAPNDIYSDKATFTCGPSSSAISQFKPPLVDSVIASVDQAVSSGPCPVVFTFSGTITTHDATTVTYRWERSDGTMGPTISLPFATASSQTVTDSWKLSTTGTSKFWAQLHVLTPDDISSDQVNFTLTCGPAAPPPGSASLDLHAGWNMISSPVGSVPLSSLQGNCSVTSGPWMWDGAQFQQAATVDPGKGYWVKISAPCTMQASGSRTPTNLILVNGWNLISSSGSWNQMNTGGCNLLGGPYWYDGTQYQQVAADAPMNGFKGYWAKVRGNCGVTIQSLHRAWVDSSMPPGPPAESSGILTTFLKWLGLTPTVKATASRGKTLTLQGVQLVVESRGCIRLQIRGSGIASTELHLYSLSGELLAQAEGIGNELRLTTLGPDSHPLANGIYLYVVSVKVIDGRVMRSAVGKLVVLR